MQVAPKSEQTSASFSLEEPRLNVKQEECFFYHVCDIPGVGQVGGHWDLRTHIDEYLGRFDFAGRSVLDVGTASGFLTFEMEKRSAEVVSFDVANAELTQIVPYFNDPYSKEELLASQRIGFEQLKNSCWFCHQHFGSSASAFYGDIHHLPPGLGPFDVVMIGMCLPHLRDPLGAMESLAAKSRDTVIITQPTLVEDRPIMQMIGAPNVEHLEHLRYAWWMLSDGCIKKTSWPSLAFGLRGCIGPLTSAVPTRRQGTMTARPSYSGERLVSGIENSIFGVGGGQKSPPTLKIEFSRPDTDLLSYNQRHQCHYKPEQSLVHTRSLRRSAPAVWERCIKPQTRD